MMTIATRWLAFALSAAALIGPTALHAQGDDPGSVSCAELLAMDSAAQMAFLRLLIAASANALDLNDLVASGRMSDPMRDACAAHPDSMAMDAAMSMQN
jgi:hypothetical protein